MQEPEVLKFLQTAAKMVNDAIFIAQSLPNVDEFAVDCAILRLQTVASALSALTACVSPALLSETLVQALHENVNAVLQLLLLHSASPSPITQFKPPVTRTGRAGRPLYSIDLDKAEELRWNGATWEEVAKFFNISSRTLYRHMEREGRPTRRPYNDISDGDLDDAVAGIVLQHPLSGAVIVLGHLTTLRIEVPLLRVRDSLKRVDPIGVMLRMGSAARRRVYKVRCANALWHQDGNEKIRPWGFYVHGCVDGYSRRVIYLVVSSNKKKDTVTKIFVSATLKFGIPSRVRGDYGTENNGIEDFMVSVRGTNHRAYLRGKSLHNIRIERLWRDVRKDCLEMFRRVFLSLEHAGLLDADNRLHCAALFLVYRPRIQKSLDEMRDGWNNHILRTECHKSPNLIYELSRQTAINEGYWSGDPGDTMADASDPLYGVDMQEDLAAPIHELEEDPDEAQEEIKEGIRVNLESDINRAQAAMSGFDFEADDGNWGISVYLDALLHLETLYPSTAASA